MKKYFAEFLGTFALIFTGTGAIIINEVSHGAITPAGIALTFGLIVLAMIYTLGDVSGAHLNPAVTLGLADIGNFDTALVPGYLVAQFAGAFAGAVLVWLAYLPHWKETPATGDKLGVFSTAPAIRHTPANLICEILGTAVLVLGVLAILSPANLQPDSGFDTGFGPALVGLLVGSIGLSLGGPTGYAINPARDLGPRLAHALLPIPGKGNSDWAYAWIPVAGPVLGGVLGACVFRAFWPAV
jgi:glycerol uptake facilitator protein